MNSGIPHVSRSSDRRRIELRGVRVHNLRSIDLDLPLHQLILVTGVSGSGKSSLAFDTLHAEGQRRYIECFSAYARQFFDTLDKPDADRIQGIPPAIAIRQNALARGARSTVSTATEIHDYLGILWANLAVLVCPQCHQIVRQDSVEKTVAFLGDRDGAGRFQIAFPVPHGLDSLAHLREGGYQRLIVRDQTIHLDDLTDQSALDALNQPAEDRPLLCIVDRLKLEQAGTDRIRDSLETAQRGGFGRWSLLIEPGRDVDGIEEIDGRSARVRTVDGRRWQVWDFQSGRRCSGCQQEIPRSEPRLFSFSSAIGACKTCQGFGTRSGIRFSKLVPDPGLSLSEGAIAAWTTPAYRHELDELLELADDYGIPTEIPFAELEQEHLDLILDGVPERDFGGLKGFFRWLERNRYKVGVRSVLNRWRSWETCPDCEGQRLQPVSRLARVAGVTLPEFSGWTVKRCREFIASLSSDSDSAQSLRDQSGHVREEIASRLQYLVDAGLGYLSLDRQTRTLSGGEAQRVALTAALGSRLVNALFVLDEPSAGLHPSDSQRVLHAIRRLRDRGNTVVVVEHEDLFVQQADWIVDVGPGAGRDGGQILFSGVPDKLREITGSTTREFYFNRSHLDAPESLREARGWLEIEGIQRHNLRDVSVRIPLGVLCVVTGVSGAGKSSLVTETLPPAIARELGERVSLDEERWWGCVSGCEQLDSVHIVDQLPLARSSRSNPVTYVKAFDEIRRLFAASEVARRRDFSATDFSFNAAEGGRCRRCRGQGRVDVDLHFLGEVRMTCPDCDGKRFQPSILTATYRGLNIAEVLDLTVNEAFTVFRSEPRILRRLQPLKDVGLGYLPLGQTTDTLSGGESQRLKLAGQLAGSLRSRQLLVLDEPTLGLHRADVAGLLVCFGHLIDMGYSLLVIEHDLDVVAAADHVIEIGPGPGTDGGRVTHTGCVGELIADPTSLTGQLLVRRQAIDRCGESVDGTGRISDPRPFRVVSGGQTGVDRAALDAAIAAGLDCGGWCPAGRRAEDGNLPLAYPLQETPSTRYSQRTQWNVRDSEATLILSMGELTGGTALTKTCAEELARPVLEVDPRDAQHVSSVLQWIVDRQVRVLNIAGPRESLQPGLQRTSRDFLDQLFERMDSTEASSD